jgi:tripartite-type tricarboxylate transporter receptor subunit TctC
MVAQKLSEHLGQPAVVENRTGAAGQIATERVATSPADGYTLMMMTSSETIRPALRANLPYNLKRDLAPVSLVAIAPYVHLVHPSVPARTVKQLVALARTQDGKLTYGSTGVGSTSHLAGELFNFMAKARTIQVPYKGSPESATAIAAGQIDMSFSIITSVLPMLDAGRIRPIAVTSAKRASLLPQLPTIDESGLPGYDCSAWFGVVAPAGVPKNIIARLSEVINKTAPEMKEALIKQGIEVQTNTPEQFGAFIDRELAQNLKLIKASGAKAE